MAPNKLVRDRSLFAMSFELFEPSLLSIDNKVLVLHHLIIYN